METIFVIAKSSFINQWTGIVDSKQRISLPVNVANELADMGLVDIEDNKELVVKKVVEVKSKTAK